MIPESLTFSEVLKYFFIGVFIIVCYVIFTVVIPPFSFPRNIPTIPFYVAFLGSYTSFDQRDIYNHYLKEKLEKYGAAKFYFGSRWNILVTRPSYVSELFKREDIYAKSGNQKKIPYAVLSKYTGDNVISSHGAIWKTYREIVTDSIRKPTKSCVAGNCAKLIRLMDANMDKANSNALEPADLLQRFTLANVTEAMLGCHLDALDVNAPCELHQKIKFVKSHIFRPLFLSFPILDKLPIPSRMHAARQVEDFRKYLSKLVKEEQMKDMKNTESAGYRLYTALEKGIITEKQFLDNALIITIAGHENPQLLLTSLLYILAKHPELQSNLRAVVSEYSLNESLDECYQLNAMIFETLRLLPPLGLIINRLTSKNVILGGNIHIPKNTYVGYNNLITNREEESWGPDSNEFKVERWGQNNKEVISNYKKYRFESKFNSFHGGKRACLGDSFALYESRLFVKTILDNYEVKLAPGWRDKVTPAGPICPLMLKCEFTKLNEKTYLDGTLV